MRNLRGVGLGTAVALFIASGAAPATDPDLRVPQKPEFYRDVLPIFQDNCQTCHRPAGKRVAGMLAPISLMSYEEARPWAKSIARKVRERKMPPWFASDDTEGMFHHERKLTDKEIKTVNRWVITGATRGTASDAPPPKVFVHEDFDGWTNGTPDLVIPTPPFYLSDSFRDHSQFLTHTLTEEELPQAVWVRGVEYKVGGSHVHHICASTKPPDAPKDAAWDSFGCISLGAEPTLLPDGYGYYVAKGSTIRFQIHYHKERGAGTGLLDQSHMGLVFNKKPVTHRVRSHAIGRRDFEIPPGAENWKVGSAVTYSEDTTLLSLWPHGHLRAAAARYEAFYPDGTTELLLWVPEYDQQWQTTYRYRQLKQIPAGTRIETSMWYDNTLRRGAKQGFSPRRPVRRGGRLTTEMMLGFVTYTHSHPIDFASRPDLIQTAGKLSATGLDDLE